MTEQTIAAADARDRFAELLDAVDNGRVIVTKHGAPKAYLISVRELKALEETVEVLENVELVNSIVAGLADLRANRLEDAGDVFAELDAEFR